jgi:hypothetical protein
MCFQDIRKGPSGERHVRLQWQTMLANDQQCPLLTTKAVVSHEDRDMNQTVIILLTNTAISQLLMYSTGVARNIHLLLQHVWQKK